MRVVVSECCQQCSLPVPRKSSVKPCSRCQAVAQVKWCPCYLQKYCSESCQQRAWCCGHREEHREELQRQRQQEELKKRQRSQRREDRAARRAIKHARRLGKAFWYIVRTGPVRLDGKDAFAFAFLLNLFVVVWRKKASSVKKQCDDWLYRIAAFDYYRCNIIV